MCAPNGRWSSLRQAQIAHLAFPHKLGHGADRILNRHIRIDSMLVVQVDHLYTKTLQTGITALAYIFWFAIDAKELAIRGALVAEFGRKYDLIAPALKRAAKKWACPCIP